MKHFDPHPDMVSWVSMKITFMRSVAAHCCGNGSRGLRPHRLDAPFTVGMATVGENNQKRFRLRIDPDGGAGIAGMPEGALRE
jgi:hypothetical protein